MDIKKIAQSLHAYERRVLPLLSNPQTVEELCAASGLSDIEVTRALQWLENKKAITTSTQEKESIVLGANGKAYSAKGLPERRFLSALSDKETPLSKISTKVGLSTEEVNLCLGNLRTRSAIVISKGKELMVKLTDNGKKMLASEMPEELFLKKEFPLSVNSLSADEKKIFESLKRRKDIISLDVVRTKKATATDIGKKLISLGVRDENVIDSLTPAILRSGEWKNKTLRRFDPTVGVPAINPGKKQPYRTYLDWVRSKFISMGFQEMDGPLVESDFWDMDALYMPQFHSARDIHDAYYVKEPKHAEIDKAVLARVKATHESGGSSGSTGWKYQFDTERTMRHLLRTQGTACSARMLASKNLSIPGRYFGITRNFRYDVIDATHLPDFNQTEGIVVEEGLTFRHLIGMLRMFAKEFAETDEIRLVPGYFPFTEPSVELYAKHPVLGWVELGGGGMLRPEVVQPLVGKHVSVAAWGLGIDRLGMFKLGSKDIRNLFSHDVNYLRNGPVI